MDVAMIEAAKGLWTTPLRQPQQHTLILFR